MKRYDLLTPEGTRDLLFEESVARRQVEQKLHCLFRSFGYSEVITPGIEFYDVFYSKAEASSNKRYFSPENMYKLTDSKGRLIVIRPDSTLPIARLIGTRLRDEKLPLKLYYSQNIFRVNPKDSGRDDEITQSGIEIIGSGKNKEGTLADFEALSLAIEVLKVLNIPGFHIEIGDCGFFKALIGELKLNDEEAENIRQLIETKNYPELEKVLDGSGICQGSQKSAAKILKELPKLFGSREVFDKARKISGGNVKLLYLLDNLNRLYDNLSVLLKAESASNGGVIGVDLGMVSKINYYTGILFKCYIEGYGMPIISGGRYDTLLSDYGKSLAAIGFAVNVNAAAESLLLSGIKTKLLTPVDVLIHCGSNMPACINRANELIKEGYKIELSLYSEIEKTKEYAKSKGIGRVEII